MSSNPPVTLAITGASGAQYGLELLRQLRLAGETVYLLLSRPALVVIHTETEWRLPGRPAEIEAVLREQFADLPGTVRVFGREEWTAPVASGSHAPRAMVVCPCSNATLAAMALGTSRSLIERAADVVLKERRKLIVVHRETPVSEIQLEHMLKLTRMGAIIMPASPGFYHRPETVEDMVDFIVARVLDHLGIAHELLRPWGRAEKE